MKCFVDLDGKIPAKDGDVVARVDSGWFPVGPAPLAWKPIETAPKDGTEVLGYEVDYGNVCAYFNLRRRVWASNFNGNIVFSLTHWMPLPSEPK